MKVWNKRQIHSSEIRILVMCVQTKVSRTETQSCKMDLYNVHKLTWELLELSSSALNNPGNTHAYHVFHWFIVHVWTWPLSVLHKLATHIVHVSLELASYHWFVVQKTTYFYISTTKQHRQQRLQWAITAQLQGWLVGAILFSPTHLDSASTSTIGVQESGDDVRINLLFVPWGNMISLVG